MDIYKSIYEFMKDYRAKDDGDIALVRGSCKMNFGTFFKQIDRVAGGLYTLGVRKGDVVMLALPNIMQCIVAVYACSRIGAIASMIHPKLGDEEVSLAVKKLKPKVIFLSDVNRRAYFKVSRGTKRVVCHFGLYDYMGLPHGSFVPYVGDGEEIAFYMQSGGTSGEPKTVAISSRSANAMAGNLLVYLGDKFSEKNAMLTVLPMFHGFGLCVGVHASISTNMRVVLQPVFNAKKTTQIIAKNHITTMLAVPRMVQKLLDCDTFRGENICSLEDVYVGGDLVGEDLVERFEERMQECGGKGVLSPGYGLTETVSVCAVSKGDFVSGSVGKPICDVNVKIVDDNLCEVAVGEVGELLLDTPQMMSGYVDDPQATQNTIALIDGKKWLKTGDYFKVDEQGRLFFMGRKKRLIKISGVNVFPSEIERVAKELDFIGECVAIEYRISGKPYIKLLVEGDISDEQKQQVQAHIAKYLSHWNKPNAIECVETFPRTRMSKIDIEELKRRYS